jgi:hypothetical protein
MNAVVNVWIEVKRIVQETWPVLPPRNSDEVWTVVSDIWDEIAASQCYVLSPIVSVTRSQWSKHRGSGRLNKEVSFGKLSF